MTIAVDWLAKRASLSPTKVALIDAAAGRRITYQEWNQAANRTARLLTELLGLAKGDRVAILASNSVEYLDLFFACNKTGVIIQNLNWRLAPPELEQLIEHAQPRVLVYSGEFVDKVRRLKVRGGCQSVQRYVALDERVQDADLAFAEREALSERDPVFPDLHLTDPWALCYTGGSTGLPKGVIMTYGNIHWNAVNTVMAWGLEDTDTALLDSSLFHTGGLNVFTTPLVNVGGTSVICREFDPDTVFDWAASGELSIYFGVPTMFTKLQMHPRWKDADFSSLRFVMSGGAPCPDPVFRRFWEKGVDFKTGYGLTEAGPNTFWLPPDEVEAKPGAVGYPLFHIEVKLVDTNGGEVSTPDVVGELHIRGPHRTPGYWNNPVATAEAIEDEGWLRTGDLALCDADGAYRIVGRATDMFISGGENVYPAEVESVIYGHPAVVEAAVFGVADETWGEVGRAVVVCRPDEAVTAEDLTDYLRRNMAHYKVPKSVVFAETLPKTGAGKIDKRGLRENYGDL